MVMLEPATKVVGAYFVPVTSAANSCPVTVGAVEVPVPPLATESCPAQARVKVLLAIDPWILVSLFTKPTKVEPKVEELVPPLAMGKMPVTSETEDKLTKPLNKPPALLLTMPVPKEAIVVEPETAKLEMEVVASVEVPVTDNTPPTVKRLEMVVEPVTAKVLELGLKVKLLDPAVEEAPVA
jgi:hypothetical protein